MSIGTIIRASLADFAAMLRLPTDAAEDAIGSERGAKAVLSRRNLFAAAAALGTGSLISAPEPTTRVIAEVGDCVIKLMGREWRISGGKSQATWAAAAKAEPFEIATIWHEIRVASP